MQPLLPASHPKLSQLSGNTADRGQLRPAAWPAKLLLGVAIALSLLGCGEDPKDLASTHFGRATEFYANDDPRSAVVELKSALQALPEHAQARHLLGRIYLEAGTVVAANKELTRARSLGLKHPDLDFQIARTVLLQGKFPETLELAQAHAGSDGEARWQVLIGDAQLASGDRDAAQEAYQSAIALGGDRAAAKRGMARIHILGGDMDAARANIDDALSSSKKDIETWTLKGELEISLGLHKNALNSFEEAAKIGKNNPIVILGKTRALLGLKDVERAAQTLAPLAKAAPKDARVNYVRALIARERKDVEQTEQALREVLAVAPNHAAALLLLGQVKFQQGEYDQAAVSLADHVRINPGGMAARKLLGAVYIELNDPDSAIDALLPVERAAPEDPQVLAMLGTAHMTKGRQEEGKTYLDRAAKAAPEAAPIRAQLAVSHLATGSIDEAIGELEAAVEVDPEFSRADVLLVLTQFQSKNFEAALSAAQKLVDKKPDAPAAYNLLGAAYEGAKRTDEARAAYQKALDLSSDYVPATLNLARLDMVRGNPEGAEARYQSILEKNPDHPTALVAMARLATQDGRGEDGLALLERARSANEKALEPRLILASYHLRQGQPDAALPIAEEASRIAPRHTATALILGRTQLAAGLVDEAITTLQVLTRSAPESAANHFWLGQALGRKGRLPRARDAFERVLELQPENARAMVALANVAMRVDDRGREQATALAKTLQEKHPDSGVGYLVEGDALTLADKHEQALELYRKAHDLQPTTNTLLKRYAAERGSGDAQGASTLLKDWVTEHPDDAIARATYASDAHQRGDKDMAVRQYERVIEKRPGNALALNNLAWLYYEAKDPRALDIAKRAYDAQPNRPEIMDTYGWLLVQSGNLEQGLQLLSRAAEARPSNGDIVYHHAAALVRAGDGATASRILKKLLADNSEFPERVAAQALLSQL